MSLYRSISLLPFAALAVFAQTPEPVGAKAPAQTPAQAQKMDVAAQRNENIAVYEIDTNVTKELNVRVGTSVTIVPEMPAEMGFYAAESGQPPSEQVFVRPSRKPSVWHTEMYEWLQNSVFNARTFFQVGGVKPSHRDFYGGRFSTAVPFLGYVSLDGFQRKIRGNVNGNVLVPLVAERTPLATDPAVRSVVSRWMLAYPVEAPNRLDFDPRALNTNSPQKSDATEGTARVEPEIAKGRVVASYTLQRSRLFAFQLVAGQNPNTEIHSHRARVGYYKSLSAATNVSFAFAFQRTRSALLAEPNAVGPRVRFGYQIEELGPDSHFPIKRAQNSYRYGALWSHQAAGGKHALTAGGDITRLQLNGIETNNQRGLFWFTNNYGRTAVDNFRWGAPSMYEATIGELSRGFRNWGANFFFGDKWSVTQRFQIYLGLRYGLETAPSEVNNRTTVPYGCDCNNFSPRFSLAWRAANGWVMRSAYTTTFGQILPVTWQQVRNNYPEVRYVQVQNPDFLNPLKGIDLGDPNGRTSPTVFSPDMVAPYSHQYNFSMERRVKERLLVRLGYVGSRSFKMLNNYQQNRAEPVPGIPLTTATVDQRRPDQRYYDTKLILNGGIAYMDAGQAMVHMPAYKGLAWTVTYTFGKAIDEGSDFTFTAANKDASTGRNQYQYDSAKDRKGLSFFDSTHSFQVAYSYELPRLGAGRRLGWLADGWQISGVTLFKTGTPLTLFVGSDGPGFGNVDGGSGDRPNIVDPSILGATISHPDTAVSILRRDRSAYLTPGQTAGSVGRGTFRKAPIANFNAALGKEWRLDGKREWRVLLRGEAYSVTNHAQFDEPQRNLSSPAFGKITNTLNDGRVLQLGIRLVL